MHRVVPLVTTAVTSLESGSTPGGVLRAAGARLGPLLQGFWRSGGPVGLAHDLVMPYGALLETALGSDLTRAPVAAFASHSSAGPHTPGGSFYVFWQAAYHVFGFLRPTRRLAGHTVPGVAGLFTCGASTTAPVGGIAGSSGKAAALRLLSAG